MFTAHSSAENERIFSTLNLIKTKIKNKLNLNTCESMLLSKDFFKMKWWHVLQMFNRTQKKMFLNIFYKIGNDMTWQFYIFDLIAGLQ